MAEQATSLARWWRRGALALVGAVVVVGVVLLAREFDARARVARETPAFASLLQRARLVGLRDFGRTPSIGEIVDANYASPQLIARLVRPGAPATVRWRPMTGDSPPSPMPVLLDAAGAVVAVDPEEAQSPMRLGSLVLYPFEPAATDQPGEPIVDDWVLVVLAGGRLRESVVVAADGTIEGLDDEALSSRLAELNARREAAGRSPRPDPRSLADLLAPR